MSVENKRNISMSKCRSVAFDGAAGKVRDGSAATMTRDACGTAHHASVLACLRSCIYSFFHSCFRHQQPAPTARKPVSNMPATACLHSAHEAACLARSAKLSALGISRGRAAQGHKTAAARKERAEECASGRARRRRASGGTLRQVQGRRGGMRATNRMRIMYHLL